MSLELCRSRTCQVRCIQTSSQWVTPDVLSADWTLFRLSVRFSVMQVMCCVVASWTFTSHLRGFFSSSQEIELKSSCLRQSTWMMFRFSRHNSVLLLWFGLGTEKVRVRKHGGLDYGDSPATTETAELSTGLLQKTSGFVTIKTSVL